MRALRRSDRRRRPRRVRARAQGRGCAAQDDERCARPHLGSAVVEMREEMANIVVDNISLAFLDGKRAAQLRQPGKLARGVGRLRDAVRVSSSHGLAPSSPSPTARSPRSIRPKAALERVDPELRMAKSASADDILAVARDADADPRHLREIAGRALAPAHALQGDRPLRPRRRQHRHPGGRGARHHRHLCARLLHAGSVRPRHGAAAALARKVPLSNKLVQSGRWEMPPIVPIHRLGGQVLGLVGFGNIPRTLVPKAKAFGLRVITHDPYVSRGVPQARRGRRQLRRAAGHVGFRLDPCAADAGDARPVQRRHFRQDEEGRADR